MLTTLFAALVGSEDASGEGRRYVALSSGYLHTCALADDGTIACWGDGDDGRATPPPGTYTAMDSGSANTCAIRTDGALACWGWDYHGHSTPPEGTFKVIATGTRHTCAIRTDDTAVCWGYGPFQQDVAPEGHFKALAIGWEHSCAIRLDDTIACWGLWDYGLDEVPDGAFKAISAGHVHNCAIASDDTIRCWGRNATGQTDPPAGTYTAIRSGDHFSCALATDGTLACWGDDGQGQSSPPSGTYKALFAEDGARRACAISTDDALVCWGHNAQTPQGRFTSAVMGSEYTCAITEAGAVACWGFDRNTQSHAPAGAYETLGFGEFHACALAMDGSIACWGDGPHGQTEPPAGSFQALGVGGFHSCALATDGSIACWGSGTDRQTAAPAGAFRSLSAGFDHTCAIAVNGSISCWGANWSGQSKPPTGSYRSLSSGEDHTCAIATDDSIACWGDDARGQSSPPPGSFQSLSSGENHTCAIAGDGSIACWGSNSHGQSDAPAGSYKHVRASEDHTCAITTGGSLTCWGANEHGQSDPPTGGHKRLAIIENQTCAIATDDTIACWGLNFGGGFSPPAGAYREVAVGREGACAIRTDGAIVCWPRAPASVYWVEPGSTDVSDLASISFELSETTRSVDENVAAGTAVGGPVAAVDIFGPATYSLGGADAGAFDVLANGQLLTRTPLNFEVKQVYEVTVTATDDIGSDSIEVTITVIHVNDPPLAPGRVERSVDPAAEAGTPLGSPVTASDEDGDPLTYRLTGGGGAFAIDQQGQVTVTGAVPVGPGTQHTITITVTDTEGAFTTITMLIRVTGEPVITPPRLPVPSGGGGFPAGLGGGGGPTGPEPSDEDFEWTVDRDIEALDGGNGSATGIWSNGATLWIADNPNGVGDAVYAYDLETGERAEEREFELHETNRAPRGVWSDRVTIWVSDSGQDRLFAYDLESGERLEEREIALSRRNDDPRGIWSDGTTMWVLDDRRNALFAYHLATGELLGEYALDPSNSQPHGIWSDGVTVWVSDHGAKRLFAYVPPLPADDWGKEDLVLERVPDEDFLESGRVGNNSPRGIWSDGGLMYVADANDGKVYTYNMPDAIDARLASLTLEGVEIGEFASRETDYAGLVTEGLRQTTVDARAVQDGATVAVEPADADEQADGHQAALAGIEAITVTVTSEDGSRARLYRVALAGAEPSVSCLRGAVAVGFSLVVYAGGSLDDLVSCAQGRRVTALYALHAGEYLSHILGAPDFVNARFNALYADGVPALTVLTVSSDGPAIPDPAAPAMSAPRDWPACLQGEIVEAFSLVLYEGGTVGELADCARSLGVASLYALADGEYVPYIVGAPEFVNRRFAELFPDGVPTLTPLVARGEATPASGSDGAAGN